MPQPERPLDSASPGPVRRRPAHAPPVSTNGEARAGRIRAARPVPIVTADATLIGHTAAVHSVAFHPDRHTLLSAGVDGTVRLWDLTTRHTTTVLTHDTELTSVALSPDGHTIALAGWDGTITLWTAATEAVTTLTESASRLHTVVFHPDGRSLASSERQPRPTHSDQPSWTTGSVLRLWDLTTGEATVLSSLPEGYGHALAFHPAGHTLAAGAGMDGSLQLVDIPGGEVTMSAGHAAGVTAVAFGPDGRTLATGSLDETVRLWHPPTGRGATITPRGGCIQAVAISPDGHTVGIAGTDDTVQLWDVATRRPVRVLFGHTDYVTSMVFSPDGHTLATAGQDRTVRLWPLD
jgi:WD40 repeat protein